MFAVMNLTILSFWVESGLTTDHSMSRSPVSDGLWEYLQPRITSCPAAFWMLLHPGDVTVNPSACLTSVQIQTKPELYIFVRMIKNSFASSLLSQSFYANTFMKEECCFKVLFAYIRVSAIK